MKKTFKKIAASLTAAVLCALPLANTLTAGAVANANARYTYRTVFATTSSKNIKYLVAGVACKSANTDAPVADKIASGTFTGSGGGAPGLYAGGVNFYPTNRNVVGGLLSFHTHCNSPSDYKEVSITNFAYDANGKAISNAVKTTPTFLVGDINFDKQINEADHQILYKAIQDKTKTTSRYKFNYSEVMNVAVGNTAGNYSAYSFDINNDGYISSDDNALFMKYLERKITRFEE